MQLPAFFGRKKSINLLPKDAFESSALGVVMEWALVFGKWSVIVTQLIVMGAFLWRFGLDRRLTDLRKEMAASVAVIESYSQTEEEFLLMQRRVEYASQVLSRWELYNEMLATTEQATPSDVWYERLSIVPENLTMAAYSSSLTGFGRLLTDIAGNPRFGTVNIGSIEDGGTKGARLKFDISLGIKNAESQK